VELLAVRTARTIVYATPEEINPRGKAVYPGLTQALVERYGFMAYPQGLGDYDEEKGVAFGMGQWNDIAIDRLTLFNNGMVVDTRSSTADSEKIITDGLEWVSKTFGLIFRPDMIERRQYLSELVIRCNKPLDGLNPKLAQFASKITEVVGGIIQQPIKFETSALSLGLDTLKTKLVLSPFRIERLIDVPFSENKFYSGAPLPTDIHLGLLEEFESLIQG
jgi:hypothetical protein